MKRKYPHWYQRRGLKHVTAFVTVSERNKLKQLAKNVDKSLTRFVSRLLQNFIRLNEEKKD